MRFFDIIEILSFYWRGRRIMTEERKRKIKLLADSIRKKHHIIRPDFDLLKYLVDEESFEIQLKRIEDNTTGLLFVDDNSIIPNSNSHRVIVINQSIEFDKEFQQKRRFICAHEYGHFLLHKKDSSEFARRDIKGKTNDEEQEAEYFAYCLLLPEKLLFGLFKTEATKEAMDSLVKDFQMTYEEVVARLFNVSIKKAKYRLNELGLN